MIFSFSVYAGCRYKWKIGVAKTDTDKEKEIGVLVLSNAADYNDAVEELCNSLFLQINE